MINTLKDKDITKNEIFLFLKTKLRKEKEQAIRNITSEKSFETASWDKYLAHQLGYLKCVEELDMLIPDPEPIK